jgi:pyridoxamine 5'-phosphate oxidase family protein
VIDDLKTVDPWDPRGIRIYGTADIVTRQSGFMEQTPHPQADYIRIKPEKKWSWGIHGERFGLSSFLQTSTRNSTIFLPSELLLQLTYF